MSDNIEKIVDDALNHDKKLNENELKIVNEISENINKVKENLDKFREKVFELKKYDELELDTPLSKDREYIIFFSAVEEYNKINKELNNILSKLLEYKKLLDEELY